jgi:hypothetical protein
VYVTSVCKGGWGEYIQCVGSECCGVGRLFLMSVVAASAFVKSEGSDVLEKSVVAICLKRVCALLCVNECGQHVLERVLV